MSALLHPSSKRKNQTGTFLEQILGQFLNRYTSAQYTFQHMWHRHISVHSSWSSSIMGMTDKYPQLLQPGTAGFAEWGQKGFLELSAMPPWYLPYLRQLMWKLTVYKELKCYEPLKNNPNTESLSSPFTHLILCEVALSPLSSLLTKEIALSSACCLVFLFTIFPSSKKYEL